jgi:hypothetical protein
MSLKGEFPRVEGLNILGLLSTVKHKNTFLVDPTRKCLIKLALEGYLSAFVGASVQGALGLSLSGKPSEEAKVEAGGFGGAQLGIGAKGSILWTKSPSIKFSSLGSVGYDATASAGIAGKAALKVGFKDARFYFEMEAGATLGLGGSGSCKWEVDAKEAIQFIGLLYDCVNFHFVTEVATDAHRAFVNYSYAYHVAQAEHYKRQAEWAQESQADFGLWLKKIGPQLGNIKRTLFQSSLSYSMLAGVPPQALAQSIRTIMHVREKDDFRVIMNLLKSTVVRRKYDKEKNPTANHKLKWVLRYISDEKPPVAYMEPTESKHGIELWKRKSLSSGIYLLRNFGYGQEKWLHSKYKEENEDFVNELDELLSDNGMIS